MFRTKTTVLVLFLLLVNFLSAQQQHIQFKRLTIYDGLSLSSVYCIFQDSKGFMWFGTEDGLNRYDGQSFTIFRNKSNDANSIAYKWIEQIYEDSNGKLWFASQGGLTHFDMKTERFTQFTTLSDPSKQISNDTITQLFEDNNKTLWVGTKNGLNLIDTRQLKVLKNKTSGLNLACRINAFLPSADASIWIATDNGLFLYNSKTDEFATSPSDQFSSQKINCLAIYNDSLLIGCPNGLYALTTQPEIKSETLLSNSHVESIYIDKKNNIWIGTQNGLYGKRYGEKEYKLVIEAYDSSNSLATNTIKPIIEDQIGNIWYGSFGSGLYKINSLNGKISHYTHNSADPQSLSENSINCLYEDRSACIWLGTFGAGISIYDPQAHKFELLKHDALSSNSLASNFVWSIWEDHKQTVWIGTNNAGLSAYDRTTGNFKHYQFPNNPAIRDVYEDSKGQIWVGTDGEGLFKMNSQTGQTINYKHNIQNTNSLSNNSVRVIFEDSEGIVWVGTRRGLNRFNPQTNTFKRYLHNNSDPNSISHDFIYSSIYEDHKGRLWIGNYGGGFNILDKKTDQFTSYQFIPNSSNSLSNNVVFSFYEDPNGIFWIGTNDKLNRFDPKSKQFTHFGISEGLPNEVIYGILPDEQNHIWLSTNFGVCRFNIKDYSVKNFSTQDGLQSNEFNGGAFHKGASGLLYFGGVYGLNIIDPKKEIKPRPAYNAVITKLQILGKDVVVAQEKDSIDDNDLHYDPQHDNYWLKNSIIYTDNIVLDYQQRHFSLEFSSLSGFTPENVAYKYRMLGLYKTWIDAGERNFVSYSNLKPGNYLFQLKAQNPDGIWSPKTRELSIIINPPFWMEWWFILLEILLLIAIIIFNYRYLLKIRTNKLLRIQNEKISTANKKLTESEQNLKELNATKDTFFKIISHDLKNPFTSLMSISQAIDENYEAIDNEEKKMGIKKINEGINHIYALLENLLTWSRSQTGKIKYDPQICNLSDLIKENIALYMVSANKKNINIDCDLPDEPKAFADKEMISTVIRNLINNAVKFTKLNSTIHIILKSQDSNYKVEITDQGEGISEENINKLFRIDKKYKTTGSSGEKGTGLGLLLCKEFIEINKGTIGVKSTLGEGSCFYFTLPKAKS
ncbi:sensor histidine kinase [Ancylomarina salipaludis]|uniref:histidine kinase n=1 Tax=Ancylomarina salipaludis TaxID=2501299 RepID=A0A4Q1JP33_9BACT|nr:sensor histidine kinase [Ancylomarina salipaludis]RXQ95936.1 sensor histidine kinase [Ancylomarina salipaludis]